MSNTTPLKQILKTSLPAAIDLSSQTIMWAIEAILVAQLGSAMFAGVGIANQITVVILTVFLTFIVGASILVSRYLGAKQYDQANHVLAQALIIGIGLSLVISLVLYYGAPNIFKLVRESSNNSSLANELGRIYVEQAGVIYLKTVAIFIPIVLTNFMAVGIIRGAGDTHLSMLINVIINVLNVILAPILIFGMFFFPRLEVHGAALAVGISHSTGFLVSLYILRTKKSAIFLSFKELFSPNFQTFKRLFKLGFPTTVEQMVWASGMLVVTSFAAYAGVTVLTTHQIFVRIQTILSMAYLGFGMGAMTLMGKNLGAEQHRLAEKTVATSSRVVFVFILTVTVGMISFSRTIISIFATEQKIMELGAICIVMFSITQIPKAMNGVIIGSLRGCGDLKWLMWTTILGVILFEVGFNWVFLVSLKSETAILFALWAVQGADEAVRCLLNYWRFRGGKWKFIDNI